MPFFLLQRNYHHYNTKRSSAIFVFFVLALFSTIVPTTTATRLSLFRNHQRSNNNQKIVSNSNNKSSNNRVITRIMSEDSTVLRELKETIRKQAAEIEKLKKQSPKTSKPSGGHGGHGGSTELSADEISSYIHRPFYSIASERVGWLSLFLVSLSFTALIMNGFEHVLSQQLELAYFVPLLAGHGGNTGGQTVGTVLSALSAGTISLSDAPKIISKEAMSGLMVGIILGSIVGPVAYFGMNISLHVSTVIGFTLPLVSTIASTLGSTIPFVCIALGLNPSVIAAPAMTSFVDVTGLMSYFLIANQIFTMFGIEL